MLLGGGFKLLGGKLLHNLKQLQLYLPHIVHA
jgi:hypothetical protein